MIYLKREKELFAEVQRDFNLALRDMHEAMSYVYLERGERVDTGSPLHHRISPGGMLHEIKKKVERIEATIGHQDWEENVDLLSKVIEECIDIANYACFLGALAKLLQEDVQQLGAEEISYEYEGIRIGFPVSMRGLAGEEVP